MNKGVLTALAAYTLWGLLPLYWKLLDRLPAIEILAHRVLWSFACFVFFFALRQNWSWLRNAFRRPTQIGTLIATSTLITANWGLYIWAVNSEHVVETSLGYFINPLMSVALGVLILGETLRPLQWASVAIAFGGVLYLTFSYGTFPWIAIALALTFALYGLLKKRSNLSVMQGMFCETAGIAVPAFLYLTWLGQTGNSNFRPQEPALSSLLTVGGALTALPLILFARAAKRIPLSMLGLLQYVAPTLQFVIGVFVFREPLSPERLTGFGMIWAALLVFTFEHLRLAKAQRPSAA